MATCVPVRDLKDTASFTKKVEETQGPLIVTKNGYEVFYALKPSEYDALQQKAAEAQLLSRIMLAEQEIEAGEFIDYNSFLNDVERQYEL